MGPNCPGFSETLVPSPSPRLFSSIPALGYTIASFSNGCPGEGPRFSAPRRPSTTSSLWHPALGEEPAHALIAPEEQVSSWVGPGRGAGGWVPPPSRQGSGRGRRLLF